MFRGVEVRFEQSKMVIRDTFNFDSLERPAVVVGRAEFLIAVGLSLRYDAQRQGNKLGYVGRLLGSRARDRLDRPTPRPAPAVPTRARSALAARQPRSIGRGRTRTSRRRTMNAS